MQTLSFCKVRLETVLLDQGEAPSFIFFEDFKPTLHTDAFIRNVRSALHACMHSWYDFNCILASLITPSAYNGVDEPDVFRLWSGWYFKGEHNYMPDN